MVSNTHSDAPLIHLLRIAKSRGLVNSWALRTRHLLLTSSAAQYAVPVVEASAVLGRMIHDADHIRSLEVIR